MPQLPIDLPLVQVYLFVLGACLGSFVGVVVDRLPLGLSVVSPRSRCGACKKTLAWYDNIPLLSYGLLRGRCRGCGVSYGSRSAWLELLTGLLLVALYTQLGPSKAFVAWVPVIPALMAITFLDIDHFWVPDAITLPLALWAMACTLGPAGPQPLAALWGLVPAAGMWAVAAAFMRITGKEGLGLGDIKLLAVMGLLLGLPGALLVLFVGSVQGALVGGLVLALGGHQQKSLPEPVPESEASTEGFVQGDDDAAWVPDPHAVPFGPFLVLGCLEVMLLPEVFARGTTALLGQL